MSNVGAAVGVSLSGGLSTGAKLGLAAGALAIGVTFGHLTTRTDGSRRINKKYGPSYTLEPQSKDAARKSLNFQRAIGGAGAVLGVGALAWGLKGMGSAGGGAGIAIAGVGLLGFGATRLLKLRGAEDSIDEHLPEHTPAGKTDMRSVDSSYSGRGFDAQGRIDMNAPIQLDLPETTDWSSITRQPLAQQPTSIDPYAPGLEGSAATPP
jgi:hypothetical protein